MAAIDCGTNSIRLLVADTQPPADTQRGLEGSAAPADTQRAPEAAASAGAGGLVDVVRRMEVVRLGQGVDRTGRLSDEAIDRTRKALADYASQIRDLGAERVRMVATSASRDASNADEFEAMVRDVLGVAPEVVTGEEEAHLSFIGAARPAPPGARPPYLVVDIGGGSTEFVFGAADAEAACSVDIGCVRMTERHLRSDPPTGEQVAAAEADIAAAVDRALAAVGVRSPDAGDVAESGRAPARTLIGLAGSVTTVAGIALDLPEYDSAAIHHSRISLHEVERVTADLLASSSQQRLAIGVMHPGRADVIGAGALILRVIMQRAGFDSVVASEHDILDGIALSLT
ncbi:MAG: exopolyphosphatase [Micromonosporaceae bacterium]